MDALLAAYSDDKSSTNEVKNTLPKKKKNTDGVVRITLPVVQKSISTDDSESKGTNPIAKNDTNTTDSIGQKRKSIASLLPAPKKQKTTQTLSNTLPPPSVRLNRPTPIVESTVDNKTEEIEYVNDTTPNPIPNVEEGDEIGPQMPSAQEMDYYSSYYQPAPVYQEQDTVTEMVHCEHIPEVSYIIELINDLI